MVQNLEMIVKAVIIGHAIGDALGVPVEFCEREELATGPVDDMEAFGTYPVPAGSWSDDTSMSIAALDSLKNGILDYDDIMNNFVKWCSLDEYTPTGEMFDIGRTCLNAIQNFLKTDGKPALECGLSDERSNGNGSLMRILPICLFAYDQQKKNVFYVARHEGDSYYFTFAPWDLDLTYGHRSDANPETLFTRYDEGMLTKYFYWETGDRLIRENVNGAADKMQKLYETLRKTVLSDDAIETQAAQFDHILRDSGAYAREQQRWPESALSENADVVLKFAKERLAYLDTALYDLEQFLNQEQ
jgi:hypothetical protein